MEKTLVVVACIRDLEQLYIMFKSIEKYLSPCKFVIVVNEDDNGVVLWNMWFSENSHYLSKHQVQIFTRKEVLSKQVAEWHTNNSNVVWAANDGWISQNILKICVAEKINTKEYILLDSKNFFIKPTKLSDIRRHQKHKVFTSFYNVEEYSYVWGKDWIIAVVSKLGLPLTSTLNDNAEIELRGPSTPYTITTKYALDLLDYFGGLANFNKWFLTTRLNIETCFLSTDRPQDYSHPHFSEFYLYDLFCKIKLGIDESGDVEFNAWVLWSKKSAGEQATIIEIPDFVHVGGIHRNYIAESSEQEIKDVYEYFGLLDRGPAGKAAVC